MNNVGNQQFTEEEYKSFLDELAPFLKLGQTLYSSIVDAGLIKHKDSIYRKYRLKDDFSEKIDLWRSYPGKLANNILVKQLIQTNEKLKQGLPINEEEMKNVRFIAEKHRSAQPYFVNRQENFQARPIEEVLNEIDNGNDNINDVSEEAKKMLNSTVS